MDEDRPDELQPPEPRPEAPEPHPRPEAPEPSKDPAQEPEPRPDPEEPGDRNRFTLAERKKEELRQTRRIERQAAEADPEGKASSETEAGAEPEGGTDSETETPDWQDASSVVPWFGSEVVRLIHLARRQPALSRLRALSQGVDTWSKLLRLSCDTAEIQQIKVELAELRHELEAQKGGPRGVVRQ